MTEKIKNFKQIVENVSTSILAIIGALIILSIPCVLEWFLTCIIIKFIVSCFGLTFKWAIATGIWLIIKLIVIFFKKD